jgi:benzoylformate decarboxylase
MAVTGAEIFVRMLLEAGVRHVFGNPGTTELPLNDLLVGEPRGQYILGLHEVPTLAMADGYSQASRSLGVANVHISCGLGNAMGMLYNAFREGTPLLLTAGQTDRRLRFEEPILWGEMVRVAEPWTKWAVEVNRVDDLPAALRRAVQTALTPPTGPVFMSIPLDVQMERVEELRLDLAPPRVPDRRVRPPIDALRKAAAALAGATNPAILAGSRVLEADAIRELVAVAERLGSEVVAESGTTHGRLGFPCDHPLAGVGLPLWSPEVRERLSAFDVVLVVGMDLLRQYVYHEPARAIPENVRLVHLDEDPWQIGKNYPVEVALIGDTKTGLAELAQLLKETMTAEQRRHAAARAAQVAKRHEQDRESLRATAEKQRAVRPITPLVAMESIARALPPNVAVVEEAVTTTNTTLERLGAIKQPDGYFGHRGWALGWGLGAAIGVQLAWQDRPVIGILGEGAAMYGIQGLWTAAHYKIPVTFVICNNAQYQILKIGARGLGLPQALANQFLGLDLTEPEIDFVALAESMGVAARRVESPDQLSDAIAESFGGDAPTLIDVPIQRETPKRLEYG